MRLPVNILYMVVLASWSSGCVSTCHGPLVQREAALEQQICLLSSNVDANDAHALATVACDYSLELRRQYRVVPPAILHNCLVKIGVRKRGYCYQWADDLGAKLDSLATDTIDIQYGIARQGTWRTHCAVIITATNQSFNEGLVLDAWRFSGYLYWRRVKEDNYPWMLRNR